MIPTESSLRFAFKVLEITEIAIKFITYTDESSLFNYILQYAFQSNVFYFHSFPESSKSTVLLFQQPCEVRWVFFFPFYFFD